MGPRFLSVVLMLGLTFALVGQAADKDDVNELALEVDALQTLAQLQLEPAQLKALAKLAPGAASAQKRKPAKASPKYIAALKELRAALVEGDADTIDGVNEKVDKLRTAEKPQIDDKVEVSETAKKRAAEALKILTARQTIDFLANFGEELPDPAERIKSAVRLGQNLAGKEWQTARDHTAEEVGWLLGGFDAAKVRKFHDQVAAILDKAHNQKKPSEEAVDQAAHALCAEVAPTEVLRNIVEKDLAELLSNPGLPAAIQAHLKKK